LMSEMKQTGKSMAELAAIVDRLPQVLINVSNVDKGLISNAQVLAAVSKLEQDLGSTGRILLRPSGTEPLIRVMVEATTAEQAKTVATELAEVVATHCALT
jgi:phosphoglucosamine mutase